MCDKKVVQFKKINVIEDDEVELHYQYQCLSNEHSWKSLEEYVTNVLKQSAELFYKKCCFERHANAEEKLVVAKDRIGHRWIVIAIVAREGVSRDLDDSG